MKQLTNLTQMEKKVLTSLIDGLYAETGFSDVDAKYLSKTTNIPTKSIRAIISSLVKKDICFVEECGNGMFKLIELIYLTKSYIGLHPRWALEENVEPIKIV